MLATPPADRLSELREVLDLALQGAQANQRPDLVQRLHQVMGAVRPACVSTADIVEAATTGLAALKSLNIDLQTRRRVLRDPVRAGRLIAEQRYAEQRLRAFQSQAVEWQPVLMEGVAAAVGDVEYTMRHRVRQILDESSAAVQEGRAAAEVQRELRERLELEARTACDQLREALQGVADSVADAFGLPAPDRLGELSAQPAAEIVAAALSAASSVPPGAGGPRSPWVLSVIMPTYGGAIIPVVLPRFLNLTPPIWVTALSAACGALMMGGSAVFAERQRRRGRRAAEDLAVVRAIVDAFQATLSKQLRDAVRPVQQRLRREVAAAVEDRLDSLAAEAAGARAVAEETGRSAADVRDVEDDLNTLAGLCRRLEGLLDAMAA